MKKLIYATAALLAAIAFQSCDKTIDENPPKRERDVMELKLKGQMGPATIERTDRYANISVALNARNEYDFSRIVLESIALSSGATCNVEPGGTIDFNNPERKAKITVTSEYGESLDWWIYLNFFEPFFVGTWAVTDVKLHCDQIKSGVGGGVWDTQLSGSEFGTHGLPEYDNIIIIGMNEEMTGNNMTGTITNDAGPDGRYGNFWGVMAPYSSDDPLDMNPRLRYMMPPGEARWVIDVNFATDVINITQNNITSTAKMELDGGTMILSFELPDATKDPLQNNFYDNMWISSTHLYYILDKISD